MEFSLSSVHSPRGPVVAAHSFGRVLRSRKLRGITVEEVLMPRGTALAEHGHEDAQICFVLEGEYVETARGRSWRLQPGGAWFRPPRELHANLVEWEQDALTLLVSIESERFASLARRATDPRLLRSALLEELRSEIRRELAAGGTGAALALEGWTLLLLARAERQLTAQDGGGAGRGGGAGWPGQPPEWLDEAVLLIERHYRDPISLAAVAGRIAVHPATLSAGFRRYLDTSVGELIRERRLRYARRALTGTRTPIKQIAVEAGFYDQAHLGRCFKRRFGISPAELRRG